MKPDLLDSIRTFDGVSTQQLIDLYTEISLRTLQRQIKQLVESGQVIAKGKGPARRYFAAHTRLEDSNVAFPVHIPISADSRDIVDYIHRPLYARKPAGYQKTFLESYVPNKTFYLPESMRLQLHKMGQTTGNHPAGTYSRSILNRLLIDLSWASSSLEGNTYSRLDTRMLIEEGKSPEGKARIETQMILNHKSAIELLVENIENVQFNQFTIMNLHSALAENLLPNPNDEGRIRQHAVEIGQSVYRPLSTPQAIEQELIILLDKANKIIDPFEQSFFMMVHLPYLQPFADINKRTSRLAANIPLFRKNLCPLTFLDVPEQAYTTATLGVYEMRRVELLRDLYRWAYERSTQEYIAIKQDLAEPDPLRLKWRDLIKNTVREIVVDKITDPVSHIEKNMSESVPKADQDNLKALIIDELRRLHEGVLSRYGLRPSEFVVWKAL
jgi:Fic family protein